MAFFRITHNKFEENFNFDEFDTMHPEEWKNDNRIKEAGWESRYEYEASLINNLIKENPNIKNILEIGSGPGILSQKIQDTHTDLNYHLIDKKYAKQYFEDNKFKGTFFEKDLSNSFDTTGLLEKYDLVITNDFLEHVLNPSIIVQTIYKLTNKDSFYFISNPNWRMAHQWVYRGLFDFDNFLYFLYTHKFNSIGFYGSPLQTPDYPRIDSETQLPDQHLRDWNHYIIFKQRD
jgi:2-polyprenyl-3-methyl-5-hydroxy-6-metoxy-1,4-benzoquinol methylase|tara:strand:- start:790 stop:1488 length:699 start_codon:yes stop_codon:yes gene_type:complete